MEEGRAAVKLPHLDIEVTHRRLAMDNAEQLTINLRASPSFDAFARWLELNPAWPWLALSPFAAWQQAMAPFWSLPWAGWPWVPIARMLPPQHRKDASSEGRRPSRGDHEPMRDPKVHPFPGSDDRGG